MQGCRHEKSPVATGYRAKCIGQGRQDSNPRPSVLETDALTGLSYAPAMEYDAYYITLAALMGG